MEHKYLKDIGINLNKKSLINWQGDKKRYKKERQKYGFDSRETYNLDTTSAYWLYEHLMMFKEVSVCIDWDFHKVDIPILKGYDIVERKPILEIENHNMKFTIDLMIQYLREYITYEYEFIPTKLSFKVNDEGKMEFYRGNRLATEEELKEETDRFLNSDDYAYCKLTNAFRIYAEVLGYMWW